MIRKIKNQKSKIKNEKLRIAILSPIKRPINLDTTVSRNRVIVDLATGLIARGHKVTIFATLDSKLPGAEIIGIIPVGLNYLPVSENPFYQHTGYLTMMTEEVVKRQSNFDLIHNHMYPEFLPLLSRASIKIPVVTTVHAQMTEDLKNALSYFRDNTLVAISESAKKLSGLPMKVIHNSVDTDFFLPNQNAKRDYLLFVGRMSKAKDKDGNFLDPKGVGNAIAVAQKSGQKLKIVGNVENPEFYEELIKPHLSDKIEFVGEVSEEQKLTREQMRDLFAEAYALLNPINWEEPFGLVMAEALSCGTPVIAFNRGAVSEILVDGLTGFVIDSNSGIDGLVAAIRKIDSINRDNCRSHAVRNFSKKRMVDDYERLYLELL